MVYNSIVEPVEVVIPDLKTKIGKDETTTTDKRDSKEPQHLLHGEYKLGRCISKTELSEVYLATNRKGKQVVVKKISTIRVSAELIRNEVYAGKRLRHSHIVKMLDHFESGHYSYIVLEYIKGKDLLQYMVDRDWKPMKDKEAKSLFKQLLQALIYSHKQGIVHHDIKLENVLLNSKKEKVKLIDFGLCEPVTDCTKLSQRWCGSFDYVSPEILQKIPYSGCKSDVFSLGVILFSMLFSQLPFDFKERVHEVVYRNRPHPSLKFPVRDEETNIEFQVNELAKDLLTKMLEPDPKNRISLEDIPKHPWIKKASIFSAS
jgi:serine/threonine protein kinase